MFKEIEQNYNVPLPDINPEYDENGNITNEKEIKQKLKDYFKVVAGIWATNKVIFDRYSRSTMEREYNALVNIATKKGISATFVSTTEWNKIIRETMLKRAKNIKIKQVISGNTKTLNKKLQNTVSSLYKQGKNKNQIARALQKELGYNKNKAKSIAITEINYYKSEAQLEASNGLNIKKTWIYNYRAKEPREAHVLADGESVIGRDSYFTVNGKKTLGPQHFGDPSEDINCHCTMRIDIIE